MIKLRKTESGDGEMGEITKKAIAGIREILDVVRIDSVRGEGRLGSIRIVDGVCRRTVAECDVEIDFTAVVRDGQVRDLQYQGVRR